MVRRLFSQLAALACWVSPAAAAISSSSAPPAAAAPPVPALSPSLEYVYGPSVDGDRPPPASRAAALAAAASISLQLWVDCTAGSDSASGTSASDPLQTLQKAQQLVRARPRKATAGAVVTIAGTCELQQPLLLTAADSGASPAAAVVWQGGGGGSTATISGGRAAAVWPPKASPASAWQPVKWPAGAAPASAPAVWSLDVNAWPIPIKSMRTAGGEWVPRSPFPKRGEFSRPALGRNYSAGWLSIDPAYSNNGNNSVLPAVAQIGLRPHCAGGVCLTDILRHPAAALAAAGYMGTGPTCRAAPAVPGYFIGGSALQTKPVPVGAAGEAACRVLCCGNPKCVGWGINGQHPPDPAGMETADRAFSRAFFAVPQYMHPSPPN